MVKKEKIKLTQTRFLTELYEQDPLISNNDAYTLLKKQFPNTKTSLRLLTSSWKYILRKRGVCIPYQKELKRKQKGTKK